MMNFRLNALTEDKVFEEAFSITRDWLGAFGVDEAGVAKARLAFGDDFDARRLEQLRLRWSLGDFGDIPQIEVLPASILGNANGAFAGQTNTIYLSQGFVEQHLKSPGVIADVLLEEIGHFVDAQINVADAPGDEGAIFSALEGV